MNSTGKPSQYNPQLDGLRAVAVIFVMIHHYEARIPQWINWGTLGVRFFFVLSGFLITRILLKARMRCESGSGGWWSEFSDFQVRRLIRTLPPYYLCLTVAVLLGVPPVLESLGWTLPFLTNFLIIRTGWFPDTVSHFWSLAVQEQFYLVWPWLMFFLPVKWFRGLFLGLIAGGVLFRYACIALQTTEVTRWVSLPASLDTFAIGGILAWWSLKRPQLLQGTKVRWATGLVAFALVWTARELRTLPLENPATVAIELCEALFMGWVVACAVSGFKGPAGWFLSWSPLTYIGKISYGIYVYHVLLAIITVPWLTELGILPPGHHRDLLSFALQVSLACGVAAFSWHWIEQPMLSGRERISRWLRPRAGAVQPSADRV